MCSFIYDDTPHHLHPRFENPRSTHGCILILLVDIEEDCMRETETNTKPEHKCGQVLRIIAFLQDKVDVDFLMTINVQNYLCLI